MTVSGFVSELTFARSLAAAVPSGIFHELVEQVQPEGPERDIRLFGEVNGSALRVKHAYAGNERVLAVPGPFLRFEFGPYLVPDRHYGREWR
jgi:hypothetical protein